MAVLSVVELHKELGGEGGVFSDCSGRGGSMVGGSWGVIRWVGVLRHALSMVDAKGVPAKGGMGLAVFEGLGLLLVLLASWFLLGGWWFEGVVVQVPHRWG